MRAAWIIALKDLRQLLRDRMACFFALVFPLLVAIFFGTIFSSGSGGSTKEPNRIPVTLVDEDRTEGSAEFAATLRGAPELRVSEGSDRAQALDGVRTGKVTACIVLPDGFGRARQNLFWPPGASIGLAVDPARSAEAGMLEGILTKYGFMQMQDLFQRPGAMRGQVRASLDSMRRSNADPATRAVFERFFADLDTFLGSVPAVQEQAEQAADGATAASNDRADTGNAGGGFQPLRIRKLDVLRARPDAGRRQPQNSFAITFPQGIVWGVMGCAMGFSIGLALERSRGTMIRLRAAPISRAQILGGKALACLVATLAVSTLVLLVGVAAFGVRPQSPVLLAAAILSIAACFVGIMMLLSVIGGSERAGSGLGWGVLLILAMIGGGMIPLFIMPGWMQSASVISPIRWSIIALEGAIWRGFTPGEMLLPCAVLVAIGVGGFVIGSRVLGRDEG